MIMMATIMVMVDCNVRMIMVTIILTDCSIVIATYI